MNPLLEVSEIEADEGNVIGRDPRKLTPADFEAAGVELRSVADAVRAKCMMCCHGAWGEVRKCTAYKCPLWPMRMGSFPRALRAAVREEKVFKPGAEPSKLTTELAKEIFGR